MNIFQFSFLFISLAANYHQSDKICHIQGTVVDRDSKALILRKATDDTKSPDFVRIPIINQSFSYDLHFDELLAYKLIFEEELERGAWRPIEFFPVNGKLSMTLYPMDRFTENQFEGSELTNDFLAIQNSFEGRSDHLIKPLYDSLSVLKAKDLYFSDSMKVFMAQNEIQDEWSSKGDRKLYNQLKDLRESGIAFSKQTNAVNQEIKDIRKALMKDLYDLLRKRMDVLAYYMLIDRIYYFDPDFDNQERLQELQKQFATQFDNHPYNEISANLLWNVNNVRVGQDYFDFSRPDLKNNIHTLSDEIGNKYAILHLWAPWCGPCIRTGNEMIPLYEKYRDKGLEVIGVIGHYQNMEEVNRVLSKTDYPWLKLLDEDWNSDLWVKYVGNGGGSIYLIDDKGKIVSVYPGVEEVETILSSELK